jgi:hypothetical protein
LASVREQYRCWIIIKPVTATSKRSNVEPPAWRQRVIAGERLPNRLFRQPKCQGTIEDHRAIALDVRDRRGDRSNQAWKRHENSGSLWACRSDGPCRDKLFDQQMSTILPADPGSPCVHAAPPRVAIRGQPRGAKCRFPGPQEARRGRPPLQPV